MRYQFYIDSFLVMQFFQYWFVSGIQGEICRVQKNWRTRILLSALLAVLSAAFWLLLGRFSQHAGSAWRGSLRSLSVSALCGAILALYMMYGGKEEKRRFRRAYADFWISCFVMGGSWIALLHAADIIMGRKSGIWMQLVSGILVYTGWKKGICLRYRHGERQIFAVELKQGERNMQLYGLADSGNSLADPITGQPVCLLTEAVYESFLPSAYRMEHPERFRVIPFHSVGTEHGMLEGFVTEQIIVHRPEGDRSREDVILAKAPGETGLAGCYDMILNRCF